MEGDAPQPQPSPSHIYQVPNEVLAQIFTTGTEEWKHVDPGGLPFPVLVSMVCRHWRILSLGSQNLWTFIVPPLKRNPTECLRWTSEWIRRSGEMAISIILNDGFSFAPEMNVDVGNPLDPGHLAALILTLIMQYSHRLYRIDVCLRKLDAPIMKAMENISTAKPPLQQLSMYTPSGGLPRYLGFSDSSELSWLQRLPNLTTFRFRDSFRIHRTTITPAAQNLCTLPYTISNLTTLDLSYLRLTHLEIESLFGAPHFRVQSLVLRHLYPEASTQPSNFSPIRVDTLRSIAVSTAERYMGDQKTFVFSSLVIPNLTYLEIDSDVRISVLFGNSISTSKIETLKIINRLPVSLAHRDQQVPMRYKEDMNIFRSFHDLQNLELIRLQVSANVLFTGLFSEDHGTEITRNRSINFRDWASNGVQVHEGTAAQRSSSIFWAKIRSITLDTVFAEDVKSLIDFVKLHESVREIALSSSAMRNLADLGRKGEEIILPTPGLFKYREGMATADKGTTRDVSEWLGKRVRLIKWRRNPMDLILWEKTESASRRRSAGEIRWVP